MSTGPDPLAWQDGVPETALAVWREIVANGWLQQCQQEVYEFALWACAPGRTWRYGGQTYPYNGAISILDVRRHWQDVTSSRGSRVSELYKTGHLDRLPQRRRDPISGNLMCYHRPSLRACPRVNPPPATQLLQELVQRVRNLLWSEHFTEELLHGPIAAALAEAGYTPELCRRYPDPRTSSPSNEA